MVQVLQEATRQIRSHYDFYEMTLQVLKMVCGSGGRDLISPMKRGIQQFYIDSDNHQII